MVKTIRISLDNHEHKRLEKVKGERTWEDVLLRGIESIENWSTNQAWAQALMNKIEESGEL